MLMQGGLRVRLVANACGNDDLTEMQRFVAASGGTASVVDLRNPRLVGHGIALETMLDRFDDGEYFCFVDSDVKARRRFLPPFLSRLTRCDAITSCSAFWSDDTVLPEGAAAIAG